MLFSKSINISEKSDKIYDGLLIRLQASKKGQKATIAELYEICFPNWND